MSLRTSWAAVLFGAPFSLLVACSGPAAPDAAVCQDVIHRLCIEPLCDEVQNGLAPGDDCEGSLRANTGCGDEGFAFSSPGRDQFLQCRGTLVRDGVEPDRAPSCDDVAAMFTQCPELVGFFKGSL